MPMKRKHLFTVSELHKALGELLEANPELADQRIIMEGRDEYASWAGTFEPIKGLQAVLMECYGDLWYNDEEVEE